MKKLIIAILVLGGLGLFPGFSHAVELKMPKVIPADEPAPAGEVAAKPTNCPPGRQCLDNPLAPTADGTRPVEITTIIGIIIKGALSVLGSVALVFFIKGGIKWLTSFGNSDMVKEGAMTMLYAALGVFLALGSYFLLNQYFSLLSGNISSSAGTGLISDQTIASGPGCVCALSIHGEVPFVGSCNVDIQHNFTFGSSVSLQDLFDKVPEQNCNIKSLAISYIKDSVKEYNQSQVVTKELCSSVNQKGTQSGFNYSVACRVQK